MSVHINFKFDAAETQRFLEVLSQKILEHDSLRVTAILSGEMHLPLIHIMCADPECIVFDMLRARWPIGVEHKPKGART